MKVLAYGFHMDPQVRKKYVDTAALGGRELDLVLVNRQGFSQVYRDLAAQLRKGYSSIFNGLLAQYPPPSPLTDYDLIGAVCFSAGYGAVLGLLDDVHDSYRLDFVCGVDSFYAGTAPDKTPVDAHIASLVRYARRAKDCPIACWLGFTDVRTYTYEETGEVAREVWLTITEQSQLALENVSKVEKLAGRREGGFHIHGFNLTEDDATEHSWALTKWGPGWLSECIHDAWKRRVDAGIEPEPGRATVAAGVAAAGAPLLFVVRRGYRGPEVLAWQEALCALGFQVVLDSDFGPATEAATRAAQRFLGVTADGIVGPQTWMAARARLVPHAPSGGEHPALGVAALEVARAEQALGVREIPGAQHHPRIIGYFARCERPAGKPVGPGGWTDDPPHSWCAAGASWCLLEAAARLSLPRERWPHLPRLAVHELWSDARQRGTAHEASTVRSGAYVPRPGDLWVQVRQGERPGPAAAPFPSGLGHVGRLVRIEGDSLVTLDANINDTWTEVSRRLSAPELVGLVAY